MVQLVYIRHSSRNRLCQDFIGNRIIYLFSRLETCVCKHLQCTVQPTLPLFWKLSITIGFPCLFATFPIANSNSVAVLIREGNANGLINTSKGVPSSSAPFAHLELFWKQWIFGQVLMLPACLLTSTEPLLL